MSRKYDPQRIFNNKRTRVQQNGQTRRVKLIDNPSPRIDISMLNNYYKICQDYGRFPRPSVIQTTIYEPYVFNQDTFIRAGSVITPGIIPNEYTPTGPLNPDDTPGEPIIPPLDPLPFDPEDPQIPDIPYDPGDGDDTINNDIPIDIDDNTLNELESYHGNILRFIASANAIAFSRYSTPAANTYGPEFYFFEGYSHGIICTYSQSSLGGDHWGLSYKGGYAEFANIPFVNHEDLPTQYVYVRDLGEGFKAYTQGGYCNIITTTGEEPTYANANDWRINYNNPNLDPSQWYSLFYSLRTLHTCRITAYCKGSICLAEVQGGFNWKYLNNKPYFIANMPFYYMALGYTS